MYKIVFSPAAVDDLLKTKKYITEELGSEQSAINTVAKITEKIGQLSEIPFSGRNFMQILFGEMSDE